MSKTPTAITITISVTKITEMSYDAFSMYQRIVGADKQPGVMGYLVETTVDGIAEKEGAMWVSSIDDIITPDCNKGVAFSEALILLKNGMHVRRAAWPVGQYVLLIGQDNWVTEAMANEIADGKAHLSTMLPWLCLRTDSNQFVPWTVSNTDAMSNDWGIASPTTMTVADTEVQVQTMQQYQPKSVKLKLVAKTKE